MVTRDRIRHWLRYPRLFSRPLSALAYYQCLHARTRGEAVSVRVRGVPVPLLCRPRTTDPAVLWSAFGEDFHLPRTPLPDGAVILDVGANVGYTTVDFALRYPTAHVIGVEMDGANVEIARRNIHPFGDRCEIIHAAAWTKDGTVRYGSQWDLGRECTYEIGRGEMEAPAVRIGTLLDRMGIERVHYLKMDIEGAELTVLPDGADWLSRIDALSVEVHCPDRTALEAVGPALQSAGFRVRAHDVHPAGILAER